jgi:TRAP-type C4-dicarboxylate transport system permease small subunit
VNQRFARLDAVLGLTAGLLLLALMLLTFADVLGRYVFNVPVRGAFELTELALLALVFAGLPLVSTADEHVTMDFVDKLLPPAARLLLQRLVHVLCAAALLGLGWLVWKKANAIAGYGDTTDVLRVPVSPFVYLMALAVWASGLVHAFKAVFDPAGRRGDQPSEFGGTT